MGMAITETPYNFLVILLQHTDCTVEEVRVAMESFYVKLYVGVLFFSIKLTHLCRWGCSPGPLSQQL